MRRQVEFIVSRLCTETPTAGGRIFETGDENLLRLAHETQSAFFATTPGMRLTHHGFTFAKTAPVVVVFTKYDQLLRSKKAELEEDGARPDSEDLGTRSKEEAQRALDVCVQSLERAMIRTQTPMPRYEKVSSMISHFSFFDWR